MCEKQLFSEKHTANETKRPKDTVLFLAIEQRSKEKNEQITKHEERKFIIF
jgi:hypothetical protein